jgi:hypothetical protein
MIDSLERLIDAITHRVQAPGSLTSNKIIALAAIANLGASILLWWAARRSARIAYKMFLSTIRVDVDVKMKGVLPNDFRIINVGTLPVVLVEMNVRVKTGDSWSNWAGVQVKKIQIPIGGKYTILHPPYYTNRPILERIQNTRIPAPYEFEVEVVYEGMKHGYHLRFGNPISYTGPKKKLREAFKNKIDSDAELCARIASYDAKNDSTEQKKGEQDVN